MTCPNCEESEMRQVEMQCLHSIPGTDDEHWECPLCGYHEQRHFSDELTNE